MHHFRYDVVVLLLDVHNQTRQHHQQHHHHDYKSQCQLFAIGMRQRRLSGQRKLPDAAMLSRALVFIKIVQASATSQRRQCGHLIIINSTVDTYKLFHVHRRNHAEHLFEKGFGWPNVARPFIRSTAEAGALLFSNLTPDVHGAQSVTQPRIASFACGRSGGGILHNMHVRDAKLPAFPGPNTASTFAMMMMMMTII